MGWSSSCEESRTICHVELINRKCKTSVCGRVFLYCPGSMLGSEGLEGPTEVQGVVLRLVLSQDGQGKELGTAFCLGRFSQRWK